MTLFWWLVALGGLGGRLVALGNLRKVLGPKWRIDPAPERAGAVGACVSVCVPARNEEAVIDRLLDSLDRQDLPGIEVVVVDDRSTDRTGERARAHRTVVVDGTEPPEGWLGKCWALDAAATKARGELLFFVDADTWHHPAAMRTVATEIEHDSLDVMVVIGGQHLGSWAERLVQPFFWTLLLSMLNPERAEDPAFPDDAMGNGQFACYRRGPYLFAGGHAGVRDRIVEDVALARAVKWKGGKYRFRMGPSLTFTRMYTGFSSLWAGFRKNAAVVDPERPGLSVALTGAAILLIAQAELWPWVVGIAALLAHVGVPRLGPFGNPDNPLLSWMPVDLASLGLGPLNLLALAALGTAQLLAIYAGRFLLYREVCDAASGTRLSRNLLCYLGQPIGAVVGLAAMLNSLVSQLRGSTEWKGRRVRARSL